MSDPTSSTGGCLHPIPALGLDFDNDEIDGLDEGVLDGDVVLTGSIDGRIAAQRLQRFLQAWFVCLTGMDPKMFRPRWQPEAPNLPNVGADWAAFSVTNKTADTYPAIVHFAESAENGAGYDELQRHETFEVLVSFYGPNADAFAMALRDNAQIPQNQEVLLRSQMALVETGDIVPLPSVVKNLWLYRADITVTLRRAIARQYRVESIDTADINLKVEERRDGSVLAISIPVT